MTPNPAPMSEADKREEPLTFESWFHSIVKPPTPHVQQLTHEAYHRHKEKCWDGWNARQPEINRLKSEASKLRVENERMREALELLRNFIRYGGHTGQHFESSCKSCELQNLAEKALNPGCTHTFLTDGGKCTKCGKTVSELITEINPNGYAAALAAEDKEAK